jgi:hypothetical protein
MVKKNSRVDTFIATLSQQEFVHMQEVAVIGEKLARAMNLQGMNLMQGGKLVPSCLCARHLARLGGRL